ncbi:hypothetical protein PSUB009319_20130 [Ralstonia sp. SET104]|nr:hypothetical protein PSUB009319_20130 [Ralstonia sp. SET104]
MHLLTGLRGLGYFVCVQALKELEGVLIRVAPASALQRMVTIDGPTGSSSGRMVQKTNLSNEGLVRERGFWSGNRTGALAWDNGIGGDPLNMHEP